MMSSLSCILLFIILSFSLVLSSPPLPSKPVTPNNVNAVKTTTNNVNSNNNNNKYNKPTRTHERSITEPYPSAGIQKLLVLTVQYPDRTGTHYTGEQWKSGMFSEFVSFFKAQSYNKLQYEVDIVTIDQAGNPVINSATADDYIPLPSNITNYANNKYGWNFGTEWSLHRVVSDAASFLDSKNFDWAPYTQSGMIQNVLIMSAGMDYRYAESSEVNAAENFLLSTSFSGSNFEVSTGALLNAYTFCSEHTQYSSSPAELQMAKLGQCAHEFGHGLGIPDLYDISSQSTGVGYFDLMGYGLYANNADGSSPVGLSAWSKLTLGWATPQVIKSTTQVTLGPCSTSSNNFLQIYPNASSSTYYLVENRQSVDKWDSNFASQLSNGIVIWKVTPEDTEEYKYWNTINTLPSPYLSYPVPNKPSMVVCDADKNNGMNTAGVLDYGSSSDVYQVGQSFTVPGSNFRIVIVSENNKEFTLVINIPTSSSSNKPTFAPPLPSSSSPSSSNNNNNNNNKPISTNAPISTETPISSNTPSAEYTNTPSTNTNVPSTNSPSTNAPSTNTDNVQSTNAPSTNSPSLSSSETPSIDDSSSNSSNENIDYLLEYNSGSFSLSSNYIYVCSLVLLYFL